MRITWSTPPVRGIRLSNGSNCYSTSDKSFNTIMKMKIYLIIVDSLGNKSRLVQLTTVQTSCFLLVRIVPASDNDPDSGFWSQFAIYLQTGLETGMIPFRLCAFIFWLCFTFLHFPLKLNFNREAAWAGKRYNLLCYPSPSIILKPQIGYIAALNFTKFGWKQPDSYSIAHYSEKLGSHLFLDIWTWGSRHNGYIYIQVRFTILAHYTTN